jgi:copper chaperone CopZ
MFRLIPSRLFTEPQARVVSVTRQDSRAVARVRIDGLLCSACALNVRRQLEALDGVSNARVDLDRGEALVSCDAAPSPAALVAAVEGAIILRTVRRLLARLRGRHRVASDAETQSTAAYQG